MVLNLKVTVDKKKVVLLYYCLRFDGGELFSTLNLKGHFTEIMLHIKYDTVEISGHLEHHSI